MNETDLHHVTLINIDSADRDRSFKAKLLGRGVCPLLRKLAAEEHFGAKIGRPLLPPRMRAGYRLAVS
jgi:hypothetical protein